MTETPSTPRDPLTVFLSGDVMIGRGIDQILPHPCDPELYESYVTDARDYVRLAERRSGTIPRRVASDYVWGDALRILAKVSPAARIINLETSVTSGGSPEPKGINYRVHPDNVGCLASARIDCCTLANNHVLDFGTEGLLETLRTLRAAGIRTAGAGRDLPEARAPAVLSTPSGARILVVAIGLESSGIPRSWAAGSTPGVHVLQEAPEDAADRLWRDTVRSRRPGDVLVASVHWGGNWGYDVPAAHRALAHALVDRAGVDIVYGHSSHHPLGIEVYRGKLVLYGCGDLLNDYEGISGYEQYRGDLSLMYFARLDAGDGRLTGLRMFPLHIRRFRLEKATEAEAQWLAATLHREGAPRGTRVQLEPDLTLTLGWG